MYICYNGDLGSFHISLIVLNAAINIGVYIYVYIHISFLMKYFEFLKEMPTSENAGSYGIFLLNNL